MESWRESHAFKLLTSISLMAVAMGCILLQKKRVTAELRKARRKKKELGNVNIGAIFGMDVGGTLTKIVYFEAKRAEKADVPKDGDQSPETIPIVNHKPALIQRGSSDSLAQLDCPDHQAALENFYTFMDNNRGTSPRSAVVRDEALSVYSKLLDGRLHFLHFETRNMVDAIKYVSSTAPIENIRSIGCTGGGAHKFAGEFEEELEITFNKFDELECLVRGMHFALNNFQDECYTYRPDDSTATGLTPPPTPALSDNQGSGKHTTTRTLPPSPPRSHQQGTNVHTIAEDAQTQSQAQAQAQAETPKVPPPKRDSKEYTRRVVLPFNTSTSSAPAFPYLVVNIGSGVSILKVTGPGKAERVSGTSLGGGTYWGLCRLLTNCSSYEEVLDFAERGDANVVDMLVKDIYGGDYTGTLSGSLVASSFGKLVTKENPREGVREEDLALALLMMITNNIGQVAYLTAQLQQCSKIFFVGNFLRQNPISCRRLSYAISFWSGGKMEAMFLVHEGHFGALGTFLTTAFGDEVNRIININNIMRDDKATTKSSNNKSEGLGGENKRSRSATKMQDLVQEEVLYTDAISARNLRGRSFSDDYVSRSNKVKGSSLSPSSHSFVPPPAVSSPSRAAQAAAQSSRSSAQESVDIGTSSGSNSGAGTATVKREARTVN